MSLFPTLRTKMHLNKTNKLKVGLQKEILGESNSKLVIESMCSSNVSSQMTTSANTRHPIRRNSGDKPSSKAFIVAKTTELQRTKMTLKLYFQITCLLESIVVLFKEVIGRTAGLTQSLNLARERAQTTNGEKITLSKRLSFQSKLMYLMEEAHGDLILFDGSRQKCEMASKFTQVNALQKLMRIIDQIGLKFLAQESCHTIHCQTLKDAYIHTGEQKISIRLNSLSSISVLNIVHR